MDADPWDENNWTAANPALGSFLTWESMRKQAAEAKHNPIDEMAFRQFKLNQWQSSTVRWMNMYYWDQKSNISSTYPTNKAAFRDFEGYDCWFGLDLAAKSDLCSICYLFPSDHASYGVDILWRHWLCEAGLKRLDRLNDGRFTKFAQNGWLTVTEGEVLDYEQFYSEVEADSQRFNILGGDVDKWCSEPVIQRLRMATGMGINDIFAYDNQFGNMSDGMHRIFDMVKQGIFRWHGNPLARFCFDATEAKYKLDDPDQIKPVKPDRMMAAKRIDAVPAAIMAVNAWHSRDEATLSVYAKEDVLTLRY
jgi:phage terminase large subunit-like protein